MKRISVKWDILREDMRALSDVLDSMLKMSLVVMTSLLLLFGVSLIITALISTDLTFYEMSHSDLYNLIVIGTWMFTMIIIVLCPRYLNLNKSEVR